MNKIYVVVFESFAGTMRIAKWSKEDVAIYTGAKAYKFNTNPTPLDCIVEVWDKEEYLKSIKGDLPF